MLVLDEQATRSGPWIAELEREFEVKRVVSVIGTHRALHDGAPAAAVLHINAPEQRAVALVRLLRGQPGLAQVPLFLLAPPPIDATRHAVTGLAQVEVIDAGRAHLVLLPAIAGGPRQEERKRLEPPPRAPQLAQREPRDTSRAEAHQRFLADTAARAARALNACDELRTPGNTPARRRMLAREVRELLSAIRTDTSGLRLAALTDLLADAERVVDRIDFQRSVLVPRGVLGLLGDLVQLANADASVSEIDVELHRTRLASVARASGRQR